MKRSVCIILSFLLILSLSACTQQQTKLVDPVRFYYLRVQQADNIHHGTEDSVLFPEEREALGIRRDVTALLKLYLAGPESELYYSPIPAGTELVGWVAEEGVLTITLTEHFADLTGMDLTLACACMTRTFLGLTNADAVKIQIKNRTLDGKSFIIMTLDDLILLDEAGITKGETP